MRDAEVFPRWVRAAADANRPPGTDARSAASRQDKVATAIVVRNLTLERAERIGDSESATLSFDVFNEVDASVTDIMVSISVVDAADDSPASRRIVVRPFMIHLKEILLAGYSVHYELRLRNLSAHCSCRPAVEVIGARVLGDKSLDSPPVSSTS